MPKADFSRKAVPAFDDAPSVILVTGDVEFFVEHAAAEALKVLSGDVAELLRFEDDAPAEAISDALLNRSLFSARRIVQLDVSRVLGTDSPGRLMVQALEAWEKGTPAGRREAFKAARALLSALDLPAGGDPAEVAEVVAKRVRRKGDASLLAEVLRELPEEKGAGGPAIVRSALRLLLDRGNDGTVALVTAVAPPAGVDLLQEIAKKGLVLEKSIGEQPEPELRRMAKERAREREVVFEPGAIERLLVLTGGDPMRFASELEKLLGWAGQGGRVRAPDVETNVEDEASEDLYALYDAIGRRDAGEALARVERLLSGRDVRAGDRPLEQAEEDIWPIIFFSMIAGEVRRMLMIQARLEETGPSDFDASMSYSAFQSRVLPRLIAPVAPFGRSPFDSGRGAAHPFAMYRAAQRAARFTAAELARAFSRASDVDASLKTSAPPLETLSAYVGQLIAGV